MGKDHAPGDFSRKSGYRSDLEIAETGPMAKTINTSFGSKSHNAYIMRSDGTHEHFFYSPKDARSGWHGGNWETHNNHPHSQGISCKEHGGTSMERNSFIESLKVDRATMNRLADVSRNAAKNAHTQSGKMSGADDGGRERGDSGPASLGREAGYKSGPSDSHGSSVDGHGKGSQSTAGGSGHSAAGSMGGHAAGGHSSGGHGGH